MISGSPMLGNLHMINPLLPWIFTMLYPYLFPPPTAQVATGVKAPALSPWLLPSAPLWYAAVSADARASAGLFSKTVDGIEGFTWSWSQWYMTRSIDIDVVSIEILLILLVIPLVVPCCPLSIARPGAPLASKQSASPIQPHGALPRGSWSQHGSTGVDLRFHCYNMLQTNIYKYKII